MKQKLLTFLAFTTLFAGFSAVYMPSTANAACGSFLSFPAWYQGITKGPDCELKSPDEMGGPKGERLGKYITRIVLNVVNIMLQAVGYIAVGFIMYGGFTYLTSGGESDRIAAGRKIIMNAVVGLVISFFSVVIVSLVAGNIK